MSCSFHTAPELSPLGLFLDSLFLESETLCEGGWTLSHHVYIACCLRILHVYTCSAFSFSAAVHSLPAPLLQFLKTEVPSNGIAASCFVAVSLFYVLTNSAPSSNFSAFYQHCYFLFWVVFDNDVFVLGSSHLNKCKVNPIVLFVFLNNDGGHFCFLS